MITRLGTPSVIKCSRLLSSVGTLPASLHNDDTSPTSNSIKSPSSSSPSTSKPQFQLPDDPWASIFEELPGPSTRSLPDQYFSSRRRQAAARGLGGATNPGPGFFTPSIPRSGAGRGRGYTTMAGDNRKIPTDINAWDHIFEGLDDRTSPSFRDSAFTTRPTRRVQRKPMTASEISAFDTMFDMIFSATMEKRQRHTAAAATARAEAGSAVSGSLTWSDTGSNASSNPPSSSVQHFSAPRFPGMEERDVPAYGGDADAEADGPSDVFGRRAHSNRMRRTTEMEELFDRHKESIDLCGTDWEVMAWAARVLFQEARPGATATSSEDPTPAQTRTQSESSEPTAALSSESEAPTREHPESTTQPHPESTTREHPESTTQPHSVPPPHPVPIPIPPSIYPRLLAHLMRKMRVTYHNPHAAIALFTHAKQLSIASYVFGCTTPAYNELLRARWTIEGLGTAAGDHDGLRGVEDVLREMKANGVGFDAVTRAFVEDVRREVGRAAMGVAREEWRGKEWAGADVDVDGETEMEMDGRGETVWEVMARVEEVLASAKRRRGGHGAVGEDEGRHRGREKEGRLEARRKHWNEEWKMDGGEAGLAIGEEDRLTLE